MNDYFLSLAGLSILLRTPHPITVSERLRPFLTAPHTSPDCTVTLQVSPVLPSPARDGIRHGLEYYDHKDHTMRVFHCQAPQGPAFAVTQHFANGNILMEVLPDYLSWFTGSSGIFNRIGLETLLLRHNGLLLHASLIEYAGQAIAFTGPSGVGKSTQADLWKTHLNAHILNGDRAVLRKHDSRWLAYGSPYAGTSGIYQNACAPLKAIVVLGQAEENRLEPLSPAQAFPMLYPELSLHRWDREFTADATDLCLELLARIPVYGLNCVPHASAVRLLKKGLSL
ncbi:MAG: hypothetical protein E7437_08545 [Ruminococcaceae bacterium]|nr:hypothetical protein [Oscillospiraceae bacterium]